MQTQLDLHMRGIPVSVDLADVSRQQTWGGVLSYCANKAGLPDKAVAAEMGMQDAVWSRCKSGQNSPSGEQLVRLMEACGNTAPLYWLLIKLGFDPASVRPLESESERRVRELTEQLDAERTRSRILAEALHGRVAP